MGESLQRAIRQQEIHSNRCRRPHPAYQVGLKVSLSTNNLRLKLPCHKLSPKFIGPFRILHQVNPVSFHLELPPMYRISPTFHVSLLKPIHEPQTFSPTITEPPPPLDIDGSLAYQVCTILDSRCRCGRLQYLVDWEGYGPEERCWVNAQDILDPSFTEEFHLNILNRPAPCPRGRPHCQTPGGVPRGGGSVTSYAEPEHQRAPSPEY
ncbi:uncharacterized protein LOC131346678 [Hemibagrus wyckioides]|uniref:uncharacterized protein LOC131346678 n=1 Tax=Hemibagrus wyckioides TaxID=337641 RepID=UPI00266BBD7F|nr:uncharacterized protein LOC131346678 [Hemibagrus wyckioides]